jgi:hypothetical protein
LGLLLQLLLGWLLHVPPIHLHNANADESASTDAAKNS